MRIWKRVRSALPGWWSGKAATRRTTDVDLDQRWVDANQHLKALLEDTGIPAGIRAELTHEFEQIERISEKLERDEIHIAAFGRVGVGKSSLLNALLGEERFTTSALHGETRAEGRAEWHTEQQATQQAAPGVAGAAPAIAEGSAQGSAQSYAQGDGNVVLLDTPGIDELGGAERERLAHEVSRRADVILMVCEGDLTQLEHRVLQDLAARGRTVLLVLNKADRFSREDLDKVMQRLRDRTQGWLPAERVVAVSADPRPETVIREAPDGTEREERRQRPPDVTALRQRLWDLLEREGKSLAVLNASLFASELDEQVARRIVAARKSLAERVIRKYCLAKGLLVAVNPVPVADLLAAAGTDVAMVVHLGRIYGFRMRRSEVSKLLLTISAQMVALMGAYWGMNLVSSALKTVSAGLSTTLTATAQGALAWYATYLIGQMAQTWFARGKSWGAEGPREVAKSVLAALDRDALLREAREELGARIGSGER